MSSYFEATDEQIEQLKSMDYDGPLIMLNLLNFKPHVGKEEYATYVSEATAFLNAQGADVMFVGFGHGTFIGPIDDTWDEMLCARYPNKEHFLSIIGRDDYPGNDRVKALVDSRIYVMEPHSGAWADDKPDL